jgi:cytochrome oxidase Cu insertion factor (SCO1/SenC/PrrC family)
MFVMVLSFPHEISAELLDHIFRGLKEGDRCMKRISIIAPLIIGLSVCSLTCQRAAQPSGNTVSANAANSAGGANDRAASQPPTAPQTQLKVGETAPDFTLTDTEGQQVRLSDFRGKKNVVLAFYVLAFTGG